MLSCDTFPAYHPTICDCTAATPRFDVSITHLYEFAIRASPDSGQVLARTDALFPIVVSSNRKHCWPFWQDWFLPKGLLTHVRHSASKIRGPVMVRLPEKQSSPSDNSCKSGGVLKLFRKPASEYDVVEVARNNNLGKIFVGTGIPYRPPFIR